MLALRAARPDEAELLTDLCLRAKAVWGYDDAFMRAWGTANEAPTRVTTTTVYPNLRTITGEYLMREVTFLPAK